MLAQVTTDLSDSKAQDDSRFRRERHWEMLFISIGVLVVSLLLQVDANQHVHTSGFGNIPLPKLCLSKELFGVDCPGCGLTRSFVYLAHGDWHNAWKMHRLGWLLFISLLLQIPYRVQALWSKGGSIVPLAWAKFYGTVLIALLILNWLAYQLGIF